MMRRSRWRARPGLILGAFVCVAPVSSGWAKPAKLALGEAELREVGQLNRDFFRFYREGRYGEAAARAERECAILEEHGGPLIELAFCINKLGDSYVALGAYEKAKPLYEQALTMYEGLLRPDDPLIAESINDLSLLYLHQGEYGKAESFFQRELAFREKAYGADHASTADGQNGLAMLHQTLGAHERAAQLRKKAQAIREKTWGPDDPSLAESLNNLAFLYKGQGMYDRALILWEPVLDPNHVGVSHYSLNNLAVLYLDQGAYREAEPLLQQALFISERVLGPDHLMVAKVLNNLAVLYRAQGKYGKAESLHQRALAIFETTLGPHHLDIAASLTNLAVLYYNQGIYTRALQLHQRALEIEEVNLVRVLTVSDEPRRLSFASKLSGSLYMALHLRSIIEDDAISELALTTLLRRKNRVQDLVLQSTAALRWSLPEDDRHFLDELSAVDSQIAVLSNRGSGKPLVEASRLRLDDLKRRRQQLWNDLAKHSALAESLNNPVTIEDVQRTLPTKGVLAEFALYFSSHDHDGILPQPNKTNLQLRYAAYLILADRFDWVDLGPAAPIDEHVKAFRTALQTKQPIPPDLYDAVMRPIVDKLDSSTNHVIIAPAGALSLVPFGALHDGKQYLVEKYDLRYVTTGRDLLAPPATPPVTTTPVTIVANPTGANLPDAELEADFLKSLFPQTRVLLDDQATETNVRTIERPLVLHMATHGFFGDALNERDNPLFRSGLYLADVDQVEVDRERDDGQLTAYEVSGMDLRGTQLVVLSACETGLGAAVKAEGKELMSEGNAGLRRAFAMAGARTTVMSLWEVSGVTTQKTMEAYYRKLAEGMGRAEAMQAVQLEMLYTKEHAHPKDWAAFIVSGDDTPMVFPEGEEPRVEEDENEPPQTEARGCCATRRSGRSAPTGSMLIGLLGLVALRRRSR